MIQSYLLSEKDSNIVFAVIKNIDTQKIGEGYDKFINKVGQAIEDEFCYNKRVKIIYGSVINTDNQGIPCVYMEFDCINDTEENEIRKFQLVPVTIY